MQRGSTTGGMWQPPKERQFQALIAGAKFIAGLRQKLERKAGFNPAQPRDDLGRWAHTGSGGSGGDSGTPSGGDGLGDAGLSDNGLGDIAAGDTGAVQATWALVTTVATQHSPPNPIRPAKLLGPAS